MSVKRALVVDDSKSAQAFLSRILERHELAVDTVGTAEEAIAYLADKRPDVIFMDHLMPGMDGLQAVKHIKEDPRTATIPILMYTSQEGELYLSQARALGALGVLPKQTHPADVSRALYQLKLVSDRRTEPAAGAAPPTDDPTPSASPVAAAVHSASSEPTGVSPVPPAGSASLTPEVRALLEALLHEHAFELRRYVSDHLENHADRIVGDVRLLLRDAAAPTPDNTQQAGKPARSLWLALAATVAALLLLLLWFASLREQRQLDASLVAARADLARTQQQVTQLSALAIGAGSEPLTVGDAEPPAAGAAARTAGVARASTLIERVPFGELPLSGARVTRVRALLEQLRGESFMGTVLLRGYSGRYCLASPPGETPQLAPDAESFASCSQVAQAHEGSAVAQSVEFANLMASMSAALVGQISLQVEAGDPDDLAAAYPAEPADSTAGEWNQAAAQNNRVEIRWQARP